MIDKPKILHDQLQKRIAAKYLNEGYTVITEPVKKDLPFDLGLYQPDLIVKNENNGGDIIEIKNSTSSANIDRLREIAETVAEHTGWRFLLVTGDDISASDTEQIEELLSWEQIFDRKEKGDRLVKIGENEGAFLIFWGIIEALTRKQAERMSIPIVRFPPGGLIKQLYSQGELSFEYLEKLTKLLEIRNRLVHGFQTPVIDSEIKELQIMVGELIDEWKPEEK